MAKKPTPMTKYEAEVQRMAELGGRYDAHVENGDVTNDDAVVFTAYLWAGIASIMLIGAFIWVVLQAAQLAMSM